MSHWQKTKLKHKEGQIKKEIESHFGIKTKTVSSEYLEIKPKEILSHIVKLDKKTKKF